MAINLFDEHIRRQSETPPEIEAHPAPEAPAYLFGNQRVLSRCAPPPQTNELPVDIQMFRKSVQDAMRAYYRTPEPNYMLLVPSPAGSGKSTQGAEMAHYVAERTENQRVFYAGPRHDFFIDMVTTVTARGKDPTMWLEWQPRQEDKEYPNRHTCHWAEEINTWLGKGYDGMSFCQQVCGYEYVNKECKYHRQKDKPHPIIYGQHAHLFLGHPLTGSFSIIIGDELPLGSVVNEWQILAGSILLHDMDPEEPMSELIAKLATLPERKQRVSGPTLIAALGGAQHVIETIDEFGTDLTPENVIAPFLPRGDGAKAGSVPTNYLPTLLPILRREAVAAAESEKYVERIYLDEHGMKILTRNHINGEMANKHLVWFDATGTADLYREIFERDVKVVDAKPKIAGRIFQVTDRGNGKSSLMKYDESTGEHQPTTKADQISAQIFHIIEKEEAQNYAVGTFKDVLEIMGLDGTHFYGSRGTNAFEETDVFVVAGTPMPPIFQIEKIAKCLWPERMTPFDTAFVLQDRPYNYVDPDDGGGWQYPVSVFADRALNIILWQSREAEIIQIAHRSRMLLRPEAKVYLLTNIPIDELPPTRLLSIADLMDAPQGVNVFTWSDTYKRLENYANEHGAMTLKQIQEVAEVTAPTAMKYRDILTEKYGWGVCPAPKEPGKRGRSPSAYSPKS